MDEALIIERLKSLGIPELKTISHLNLLNGDYINLVCELPNGSKMQILDDNKQYLACEVCKSGTERCYGVGADESQIAVYEYGNGGSDAKLVAWIRL